MSKTDFSPLFEGFDDFPERESRNLGQGPSKPIVNTTISAKTLAELDLDHELLTQYKAAQTLLTEAAYDKVTPLNQKAQVLNSITAIITQIIKLQQEVHSIEEVKEIEAALIETLKEFPEIKEKFLKAYKKRLKV